MVVFCVVLLLVNTGCTLWGEKKNPSWNHATSGEHLERLFWQDVKAKNWKSLEARMAPMLVSTLGGNVRDRAMTLEYAKSLDVKEFQIGEVESRPAGVDLIVTYVINLKGAASGKALPSEPMRVMSVWQPLSKGWVLVAQSSSPAAQ